jgi:uncharacterized membrane protein YciS (DUF1049 family)
MINRTEVTESMYDLILKLMLADDISIGVENHSEVELVFEYYMVDGEYQLNIYKKLDIDSGVVIPETENLCTMQNFYLSMNLNEEDTKNEN